MKEYYNATSPDMEKPETGYDSVKGLGKNGPDYTKVVTRWDGVLIPNSASLVEQGGYWERSKRGLNYNEFIVYDEAQVKIEFIVLVKTPGYSGYNGYKRVVEEPKKPVYESSSESREEEEEIEEEKHHEEEDGEWKINEQ